MQKYLEIIILNDKTSVNYIVDNNAVLNHEYNIGNNHARRLNYSKEAKTAFKSKILYTLHQISLFDRVPVNLRLSSAESAEWFRLSLLEIPYTQFYTKGEKPNAIINNIVVLNNSHARHQNTLSKFKI